MELLLSIVIANHNYGRFLEDALQSIFLQDMGDKVEIIICDAASTDNSIEVIKKYEDKIAWWCSEKDGGQSAAFNKGFAHAKGRFLTWLNADDLLLPGALAKFNAAVSRHPHGEWFGGGCVQLDPYLKVFKCDRPRKISKLRAKHGLVSVTGPSSFFAKDLYERVGKVDERFHYMMDTNLWLRFVVIGNAKYIPIPGYLWGLRLHPDAKMSGHKFLPDGTILEGAASEAAYMRQTKRLEQLRKEQAWTAEVLKGEVCPMTKLVRAISASIVPGVMSRFDTWRWRGQSYEMLFKR